MKIELSKDQIDDLTAKQIAAYEAEIRSLRSKLKSRDLTIARMREGMDFTKEARQRIRGIAESLVSELQGAGWADTPDYGI